MISSSVGILMFSFDSVDSFSADKIVAGEQLIKTTSSDVIDGVVQNCLKPLSV